MHIFFSWIIKIYWHQKRNTKYTGSVQGWTNQVQKLHKSSKSRIEDKN